MATVTESRPWGQYTVLKDEDHFKLKHIVVEPGQRLSLQKHEKREEHWVVIKGAGLMTLDAQEYTVAPGSYINIPLGAVHRMHNTGTERIEFVEIQLGSYFGEDDIIRLADA